MFSRIVAVLFIAFCSVSDSRAVSEKDVEDAKRLAEEGSAAAQFYLGRWYDFGRGVPENDAEAVKWYRMAAEQGYASAQNNLGVMYAKGKGVPKNDAEAVKWYRMAAEQGYATAQYNLGSMYAKGEGVPVNNIRGYSWWALAAAQGDDDARKNLEIVEKRMTREQIAKAQEMAAKCFENNYKGC